MGLLDSTYICTYLWDKKEKTVLADFAELSFTLIVIKLVFSTLTLLRTFLTSSSPEAVLTESILWQRPTLASVCMFMVDATSASVSRRLKAGDPGPEGGGGTVAVVLTRFRLKVSTIRSL